jgi:heterotetrameric sarcosine oxidase gamma subunit
MARTEPQTLKIDSPFGVLLTPDRIGKKDGAPGISIEWLVNQTQAEIASFAPGDSVLEKAVAIARRFDGDLSFAHAANRVFVVARDADLLPALKAAVPIDKAAIIDQSHGRVCLAVEGPCVENVLSKLFAVDFAASVFKNGTGIATAHHVIFALIYRENETRFLLFPHRSFARDFLKALIKAGTEYGVEIEG